MKDLRANPPVEAWLEISDAIDQKATPAGSFVLMRAAAALAVFIVAAFSFWMLFINDNLQGDALVQQTMPPVMEAIPAGQIINQDNPRTLLADLTIKETLGNQTASFIAPIQNIETPIPGQLQSYSAFVNAKRQQPAPEMKQRTIYWQPPSVPPDNRVNLQTHNQGYRSFGSNITLSAHFAPQYNYRTFTNRSGTAYGNIPFSALESQIYTFSAGMNISIALSSSWAVQTGVQLNNMGQRVEEILAYKHPTKKSLYLEEQYVITSLGGIRIKDTQHHYADRASFRISETKDGPDPDILDQLTRSEEGLTQVFQFLEIPVLFRYRLADNNNFRLFLKGGLSGSYLLNKDVFIGSDITQNPIGETHGVQQFNFSLLGGFAMHFPVTGNLSLYMEPTAQLFMQSIVPEEYGMGGVLPYSFSLQTGFSYRF